jgi:hypothetical protein
MYVGSPNNHPGGHMKSSLAYAAFLLASTGLLAGCGQHAPTAPSSSASASLAAAQARVVAIINQSPQVVEDGQFESAESASLGGTPGTFSAVGSLGFWRSINHVERSFEFAFSEPDSTGKPTKAIVTVRKVLTGQFNLRATVAANDSSGTDSTTHIIHKPLEDHWVRRLLFERVPHPYYDRGRGHGEEHYGDHHRGGRDGGPRDSTEDWRLVGTSGVQVTSKDAETKIVSLRVQAGSVDTTVTEPLAFYSLRGVLKFNPDDHVTLTVTTLRSDDQVLLMLHRHRVLFTANGDNTYGLTLPVPQEECVFSLRHIGVNALSHGTLFDDQAPYDSQAWIMPFAVRPFEMTAYIH